MSTPLPRVHAFMVGSHEPVLYWLWHKVDQAKWIAPFSTTICLQYMWHKVDQAKWIAPFSTTILLQYFFFSHRAPIEGWMPTIIPTWEKVKPMVIKKNWGFHRSGLPYLKKVLHQVLSTKVPSSNQTQGFGLCYGLVITVRYPPLVLGVPVQSLSSAMT